MSSGWRICGRRSRPAVPDSREVDSAAIAAAFDNMIPTFEQPSDEINFDKGYCSIDTTGSVGTTYTCPYCSKTGFPTLQGAVECCFKPEDGAVGTTYATTLAPPSGTTIIRQPSGDGVVGCTYATSPAPIAGTTYSCPSCKKTGFPTLQGAAECCHGPTSGLVSGTYATTLAPTSLAGTSYASPSYPVAATYAPQTSAPLTDDQEVEKDEEPEKKDDEDAQKDEEKQDDEKAKKSEEEAEEGAENKESVEVPEDDKKEDDEEAGKVEEDPKEQ